MAKKGMQVQFVARENGPERLVTRSAGNVLYELDGQPALDLYRSYLGDMAEGLPATALHFPLAVREKRRDEKVLVRTILSIDEAAHSMTFAGDVREGCHVQLMRANFERLVDGAGEAAAETRRTSSAGEELAATLGEVTAARVILVSNEVGLGIVPDNPLARSFRDLAGSAHQRLAEICDDVYFIVAGLPIVLKGDPPRTEAAEPGNGVHEA